MTKSNHTPWIVEDKHIIVDSKGFVVADTELSFDPTIQHSNDKEANAALIVHRVNNWDKLVEALEFYADPDNINDCPEDEDHFVSDIFKDGSSYSRGIKFGTKAKQALALAKEAL